MDTFCTRSQFDGVCMSYVCVCVCVYVSRTQEMNTPTPGRTLTQHRKVAVNFRDSALLRIFQLSLTSLSEMAAKGADTRLKELGLQLCSICIAFDFVGTCMDDSSEELCTIQVRVCARACVCVCSVHECTVHECT